VKSYITQCVQNVLIPKRGKQYVQELDSKMQSPNIKKITVSEIMDVIKKEVKEVVSIEKLDTNDWIVVVSGNVMNAIAQLENIGFYIFRKYMEKTIGTKTIVGTFVDARYAYFYLKVPATETGTYVFEEED
jgi:hypothetical protein